ncbi:MAG: fasciclin domain-containing protein [Acidimicrobiales bacterium]
MAAAACSSDDSEGATTETTPAAANDEGAAEEEVVATDAEASGTIVDVAVGNPDFSILVSALTEAGLVETLSGDGPFTVFAPTNAALEQALADLGVTAEDLLARDDLADILTYHVVPGNVLAADVVALDGTSVATVNGAEVSISVDGDTVMINDATVTTTDIIASNGVIHVIDSVLLPG